MNQSEAESLVVKMKQLWGNPFKVTSSTSMEWAQHAGSTSYADMARAIDSFAEAGDKFPPSLAEVVSRARTYKPRNVFNPNGPKCCDCGGPTLSGMTHFSFCKPHGTGNYYIETMEEYVNK